MRWTDKNIDKLFQEKSKEANFDYKDEYWEEFSKTLDSPALTDEAIDELYKSKSASIQPEYKSAYFGEFEALREANKVADLQGVVQDDEIDDLYKDEARDFAVNYRDAYWREFQNSLPIRRRIDGVWFATASLFALLIVIGSLNGDGIINERKIASNQYGNSGIVEHGIGSSNESVGTESTIVSDNNIQSVTNENNSGQSSLEGSYINGSSGVTSSSRSVVSNSGESVSSGGSVNIGNEGNNTDVLRANDLAVNNDNILTESSDGTEIEKRTSLNESEEPTQAGDKKVASEEIGSLPIMNLNSVVIDKSLAPLSLQQDLAMPASRPSIYFELNGALSQSLISPSEYYNYSYGLGVGTQIHKGRFVLTTGLNAYISNHKDIKLSREAKVYGFGSDIVKYELNYKQLYHLEANLNLGYKLGRHQLNIGVKPSYVVNSKVGYSELDNSGFERGQEVYGYMDGINRFGLKPTIGYAFEINNGFSIGLNLGTQLLNSVEEIAVDGVNNKLPIEGQFFIRKSISIK